KFIISGLDDKDNLARFEREAQVMSKLSHQNIARVYRFGIWHNYPYLVLEYIEGTSLRALISNGPLPWTRALKLAAELANAMAHAHDIGILHRDLKPENILLDTASDQQAKIIDFGLAGFSADKASTQDDKLTKTGLLLGSINYMSPEQCLGQHAGTSSDIYALGCILYEILTGKAPFQADTPIGVIHKQVHETAPHINEKNLPDGINSIIAKAMEKETKDRYASMKELQNDIELLLSGKLPTAAKSNKKKKQQPSIMHAAVILFLVFILPLSIALLIQKRNEIAANKKSAAEFSTIVEKPVHKTALSLTLKQNTNDPIELCRLADNYKAQRKFHEALPIIIKALRLMEEALGPDDPNLLLRTFSLADIYRGQRNYKDAEIVYKRLLPKVEKTFGADSPEYAYGLFCLASNYSDLNQHKIAEPIFERAAKIVELDSGKNSPRLAQYLAGQAVNYQHQEKYKLAEPLLKRAVSLREQVKGTFHWEVAPAMCQLADNYRFQNKFAEAESFYKQSIEEVEKAKGFNCIEETSAMTGLAQLYDQEKKLTQAIPLYLRIKDIDEKRSNQLDEGAMKALASDYRIIGKEKDAKEIERLLNTNK
ncbi:MAG: serine/threonine-protein kinase, partial [Candidatus Obscuribacterales bacterium]|nr:serine/threonine-protein kinase [Candidatus Obscuribacterales bacterium]